MKQIIFFSVLFFITYSAYSQQFHFDRNAKHINDYKIIEDGLGSKFIKNKYNHFTDYAQPITYVRNDIKFNPSIIIQYFYSKTDSIVRQVNINIDSLYFLPNHAKYRINYRESDKRIEDFNQIYSFIKDELTTSFGKSNTNQDLFLEEISSNKFIWSREDSWETDSIKIEMDLSFSDNSTTFGTYRIRNSIYWKIEEKLIENFNKQIQDSIALKFINFVFQEKYQDCWDMLDEDVKSQVNYEYFIEVIKPISKFNHKGNQEIEQYMFGVQSFSPEKLGAYFSYKFKFDNSSPPKKIIKIAFKTMEATSIYGIRPMISE